MLNHLFTLTLASALALSAAAQTVDYKSFGAKADGVTDDIDAICQAHAYANEHHLPVVIKGSDTYYIGGTAKCAIIKTDTDFGDATFIIDDVKLENIRSNVFFVAPTKDEYKLQGVTSLKQGQAKLDITLPDDSLILVYNKNIKRYIRYGANQNNGSNQTDVFIAYKDGTVDPNTRILWDFDTITAISAIPIDSTPLTIRNGHFITIANQAESRYTYHARNFLIRRSRVVIDNLDHRIKGELDHGAPYGGFLNFSKCAFCVVKNTRLTGHKTYRTIGSAGVPVSMGSYDISMGHALNCTFLNCKQNDSIHDTSHWGIFGSNFCKNLTYDGCEFSRFDAHQGVFNATVRNTTLGHVGINAIGNGTFLIENSTICGRSLVSLRGDYGSFWNGEFIIRNTTFKPLNGAKHRPILITGSNNGQHDFGYECHMPTRITFQNLTIDDTAMAGDADYKGPTIFSNFNGKRVNDDYRDKYPYFVTEEVVLDQINVLSGKPLNLSDNPYMFKDVKVIRK